MENKSSTHPQKRTRCGAIKLFEIYAHSYHLVGMDCGHVFDFPFGGSSVLSEFMIRAFRYTPEPDLNCPKNKKGQDLA